MSTLFARLQYAIPSAVALLLLFGVFLLSTTYIDDVRLASVTASAQMLRRVSNDTCLLWMPCVRHVYACTQSAFAGGHFLCVRLPIENA